MSFKARNLYYLRISEQSVLPTYVYLDERHLDWMSDQVLQHVLADLRPRILPKLLAESGMLSNSATSKKVTVDTHRGDTYQFCYFLRRTEPHSVVLKTRNYVARKAEQPMTTRGLGSLKSTSKGASTGKKRKSRSTTQDAVSPPPRSAKKRKAEQVASSEPSSEEEGSIFEADNEPSTVDVDQDETPIDVDMEDTTFNLHIDEEEEKPKPALQLKYKGFSIYGRCLCIVVEPWPTLQMAKGSSSGLASQKSKHDKSHAQTSASSLRAPTPLFLADDDMGEEDSFAQTSPDLNSDDDSDGGGMMAFSQALNLAGDNRPGAAEDEQEMEGAVLFGDADENRQL